MKSVRYKVQLAVTDKFGFDIGPSVKTEESAYAIWKVALKIYSGRKLRLVKITTEVMEEYHVS